MRKFLLILFTASISFVATAQDTQLKTRLDEYLLLNRQLNFEKLMDYIHPSLFTLASREQLIEVFKQVYENDDMKITIDSAFVTQISPIFKLNNSSYHKVDYRMKIVLVLKDTAITNNEAFRNLMISNMENAFSGGKVTYDNDTHKFDIRSTNILIAIKDNDTAPWLFLGYDKNQVLTHSLFPTELIQHFKL